MTDTASKKYNCNNVSDQIAIANQHKISEATFNNGLTNFWGSLASVQEPTVRTWTEMNDAMAGQDCTEMRWKLQMDHNDVDTNAIDLVIEPIPDEETIVNYSIALFKGVKEGYNAAEFHFYKARHDNENYDIIFKAVNSAGTPVYFGDLNGLYP